MRRQDLRTIQLLLEQLRDLVKIQQESHDISDEDASRMFSNKINQLEIYSRK
jgi:hypothetical protein